MNPIYHLAPIEYFHAQPPERPYVSAEFDRDGFIRCTKDDEQLILFANRHYRHDDRSFLVVVIDGDQVTADIKYEPEQDGALYPHLYGPLNHSAIVSVLRMPRLADGSFQFPDRNVTRT
jgi:uncharacterized protein (DUF952 family)